MEADDAFERAKDPAPKNRGQGTLRTFSSAKVRPPAKTLFLPSSIGV
jgi:hypothetical protein